MCQAFVSANIPIWKLTNSTLRNFLEKYTTEPIPSESSIRKNYVGNCYEETMKRIRQDLEMELIWVSIDETTDSSGRYVADVVVGALKNSGPSKPYLLTTDVLEHTNHFTIAKLFNDALTLLWPSGIKFENVLLLVSDATAYMVKAANGLSVLFPKMIHVTCVAHGLHRVAESIRVFYPEVDRLIANTKKVFCKAPNRIRIFHAVAREIPLPPQPVITHWGTWLEAANYYAENFDILKQILDDHLNEDDAASIAAARLLFCKHGIREQLAYIKAWFTELPNAIAKLEDTKLHIIESVKLFSWYRQTLEMHLAMVQRWPASNLLRY